MPILATGNLERGFTLMEMMAVIALIGLLAALVYPRIMQSEERVALKLSGDLLISDLRQLKEAAVLEQVATAIYFEAHSYHFKIGAVELERPFTEVEITFAVPKPEANALPDPAGPGLTPAVPLIFKPDGSSEGLSLNWQTKYFKGSLVVDQAGVPRWKYEPK